MDQADDRYDVIVLGAGPAGENAADVAVRSGLRVAIVERQLVGGECSYWGCMPSKALLRPGHVVDEANRTPGVTGADLDLAGALERRDALSGNWDDSGQVEWLEGVGVELLRGHARLNGPRSVTVTDADDVVTEYSVSTAVVVATGSGAAIPPIPGLREHSPWTNREITTTSEVPRRLLVLGAGVIGVEMAQAWRGLGAETVTLVEIEDRILAVEEPFVGPAVQKQLVREGIDVMTSSKLTAVDRPESDGPVTSTIETDSGEVRIESDEIVVAVGRHPHTDDIGLETVGLTPGESITVDDRMLAEGVDGEWLFAVGDVNGRALLTHVGKYQARIAGARIGGIDSTARDLGAIPRVIFTNPQVAAVGIIEANADRPVHTVEYDTGSTAGAATIGKGYGGTAKLVIDPDDRTILGATFVGPMVGEMLHAATIAIVGNVPLDTLWHAVPSFPTVSEVWLRLLETYRDTYEHTFR